MQIVLWVFGIIWLFGCLVMMFDLPIGRFLEKALAKFQIRRVMQNAPDSDLDQIMEKTGLSEERVEDVREELKLDRTKEENQK